MAGRKLIRVLLLASAVVGMVCLLRRFAACTCREEETLYYGNETSEVFHRPGCRLFTATDDSPSFYSRDEAVESGYRPCRVCKP